MFDYKICQISDTHLTPKNARPANNQRVDPLLKLMQVFDDIYTTRVNPDLIVITGDLIHEGSANDYRDFKTVIDQEERRFNVPIRVILGNHDRTRPFYQGYLQKSYLTRYYYSISNNEWDFYFLDTKCGDLEQGYIDERQMEWLRAELHSSPKPAILFMHHPLLGAPLEQMKYSILQNGKELRRVIEDTNVKAIFSGHVHYANLFLENGILNVTADSTAYHINCANPHRHFITDGTSYKIISLTDQQIGVETRSLLLGTDTIKAFDVADTGFVDRSILYNEMNRVLN